METLITEVRERMLQRKARLLELAAHAPITIAEERAQDAAALSETAVIVDLLDARERRELEEIEAALARIDAGTYGRCEVCGQALGRQRLRAVPEARRCLGCAAAA